MIESPNSADTLDLSTLTKKQLLAYANEAGVEGVSSSMTKAQIIETIEG